MTVQNRYLHSNTRQGAMKKILDPNHPFFANAFVRWLTALIPLAWAVVEFVNDSPLWGLAFTAVGAFAFWVLIVRGPDQPADTPSDPPQD